MECGTNLRKKYLKIVSFWRNLTRRKKSDLEKKVWPGEKSLTWSIFPSPDTCPDRCPSGCCPESAALACGATCRERPGWRTCGFQAWAKMRILYKIGLDLNVDSMTLWKKSWGQTVVNLLLSSISIPTHHLYGRDFYNIGLHLNVGPMTFCKKVLGQTNVTGE
jgi:hypothetical protein